MHLTGSAWGEDYYKISHAETSAYVTQYTTCGAAANSKPQAQQPKPAMTSSWSNHTSAWPQTQV